MAAKLSRFISPLLLCMGLALGASCSSDQPSSTGPGGKADDVGDGDACEGASLDSHATCRSPDGRFAPTECCADEFAFLCEGTHPTPDGLHCQHEAGKVDEEGNPIGGQFAPSACCEALCEGAAIDASGFCRLPNGRFADQGCCADECLTAQDMGLSTGDFEAEPLPGSCQGTSCDGQTAGGCFCDDACAENGDCCADKAEVCGGEQKVFGSCEGFCGETPNGNCYCDEECVEFGDCCPDKVEACGGAGNPIADCADPCEGAELEQDTGICRNAETGQFMKSTCCAAAFEALCANTTVDHDGTCRRLAGSQNGTGGEFAPDICCEALCEGASLDRSGFCRMPDGTFAHAGCCADECVTESRLGRRDCDVRLRHD